jgi:hypothetical protein
MSISLHRFKVFTEAVSEENTALENEWGPSRMDPSRRERQPEHLAAAAK